MTHADRIKLAPAERVQTAGRDIRYRTAGAGAPVILLHAFPLSSAQWQPQLSSPPAGVRLIAPDFRGFRGPGDHGAAPVSPPMTVEAYADDVLACMDALGVERAGVCGVSMGGYVAFAMLRRAPERVTRLILANTRATPDTPAAREGRDAAIALARREGATAIAREMLPKLLGETTRRDRPDVVDTVRTLIEANDVDGIVAALEALKARPDSRPLLPSIACETVIVHGDEDTIIARDEAEAMHAAINGSRLVVMAGVGHLSNIESPAAFTPLLGTEK